MNKELVAQTVERVKQKVACRDSALLAAAS